MPNFDDHSFACTTASGYTKIPESNPSARSDVARRYVGFHHGRISDTSGKKASLDEYVSWLQGLCSVLNSSSKPVDALRRYAAESNVPLLPNPEHILLDVFDVQDKFATTGSGGIPSRRPMILKDQSCEVKNEMFVVNANGIDCECHVHFDAERKRYDIECPQLEKMYYCSDRDIGPSIVDYLNRYQSFRILPEERDFFYTLKQFYRPGLKFGDEYDDKKTNLLAVLHESRVLGTTKEEKGKKTLRRSSGWDPRTLFGIIDSYGRGTDLAGLFGGKPDILVCDDMTTESADFIMVHRGSNSKPPRVVFIHAKANHPASLFSATHLQDVCAQAQKNVRFLSRFDDAMPSKAARWHKDPWKSNNLMVKHRIRIGSQEQTGTEIWKDIKNAIVHPHADREVWLFLGQVLSKGEFEKALTSHNPKQEAVQAAYLLLTTITEVAMANGKLRVLCSP